MLATSLTPPGDSYTYVNPEHSADQYHLGWRLGGRPSRAEQQPGGATLDKLKGRTVTVPVWSTAARQGATSRYQVAGFAVVRLVDYRLPGQNWITVHFLGYANSCGDITPTPTLTATPTSPTYHLYAVHDADVRDFNSSSRSILSSNTVHALGPLHVNADIEALAMHPVSGVLYTTGAGPKGKNSSPSTRRTGA